MNKVYTSRNARDDKMHAEYIRECKALEAKVKYWDAKAAKFGGAVHIDTANKFRAQLAAL